MTSRNYTKLQQLPRWIKCLTFVVAWVGLWGLGHLGEFTTHASVWYPPAGLTFAALVVIGWRIVPYLAVATLIATGWSVSLYDIEAPVSSIIGFGIANGFAHIGLYGLGAMALRKVAALRHHSLPMVVIAFLGIATASSAATTVGVISALVAFDMLGSADIASTWLAFWIGDFVAIVVLAPLFGGLLLRSIREPQFWVDSMETIRTDTLTFSFAVKLAVTCATVMAAMLIAGRVQTVESVFLVFFMLIPQMWLTYTESPMRTAISLAVVSFLIVIGMAALQLSGQVFIYQFAIAIVATTAWFGLAIPLLVSDNRELRQRLMFDPLTGAASRDYLLQQADRELKQTDACHCLAMIDVDHFKAVNDDHGHAMGDRVLIAFTQALRRGTRGTDTVARFGGDEFVVFMPSTELAHALDMMERLQQAIRHLDVVSNTTLSASIGLARSHTGDSFEALFERADSHLYAAKKAGRDQICSCSEDGLHKQAFA